MNKILLETLETMSEKYFAKSKFLFNEWVFEYTGRPGDYNELKKNLIIYWLMSLLCFHVLYVMCEMEHPVWSDALRTTRLDWLYPWIVPICLTVFAAYFETAAIDRSLEAFCRMNPEVRSTFFGYIHLDCQTNGNRFASMQRCSYGTVCYFVTGVKDVREQIEDTRSVCKSNNRNLEWEGIIF